MVLKKIKVYESLSKSEREEVDNWAMVLSKRPNGEAFFSLLENVKKKVEIN